MGIEAGLILCTLRHFTEAQSMLTLKLVEEFRGARVLALDLARDEGGFPLDAQSSIEVTDFSRGIFIVPVHTEPLSQQFQYGARYSGVFSVGR